MFIFSGTVKAIDPLGSAYKFHDYFQAFGLGFLTDLSLPLAVLLCTIEFLAGFSVLTGFRQKTGIITVLILMLIFTPLTFILALDKSGFRLRLFWRCTASDQLADFLEKCDPAGGSYYTFQGNKRGTDNN